MINNDHSMDPRISFSNDFVDTHQGIKQEIKYREAPVSGDFEFSVRNYNMIPADEIFFKGVLLPLKTNCSNQLRKSTLREKLRLAEEDEYGYSDVALPKLPKSSGWWKEKFVQKKSQVMCKNGDDRKIVTEKKAVSAREEGRVCVGKTIQELLCE